MTGTSVMKKLTLSQVKLLKWECLKLASRQEDISQTRSGLATIFFFFYCLWLFVCCFIFVAAAFENNICSV